jgi:hypothetical protein
MWLEKLSDGFLQVLTDTGAHYVKPSFLERLRLLWMFRNFSILPQQVLTLRQRAFLSQVCAEQRMFRFWGPGEQERFHLIGTLMTSVLPAGRGDERRTSGRCPVQFEVRYGIGKDFSAGEGFDFGNGGLAFRGPRSYPAGTELELSYRMEPQMKWTTVRALVRHCSGDRIGVEFLTVNTDARVKSRANPARLNPQRVSPQS